MKKLSAEGFLIGLLSLADVILDRKMEEVFVDLPLDEDIIHAIYKEESPFTNFLIFVENYEKGNWEEVMMMSHEYDLDFLDVSNHYLEAIDWVNIIESTK